MTKHQKAMRTLVHDLQGRKFGKWTVEKLGRKRKVGKGGVYWWCRCDCGTRQQVAADTLVGGKSESCGCGQFRQFCPKGHDTHVLGRSEDGTCRKCIRNKRLIKLYGITVEEYEGLWVFQDGKCAICEAELQRPDEIGKPGFGNGVRVEVDHNHDKNLKPREAVRGLLCGGRWKGCNRKLGNMDQVPWLRKVLAYLENPPAQAFIKEQDGKPKMSLV